MRLGQNLGLGIGPPPLLQAVPLLAGVDGAAIWLRDQGTFQNATMTTAADAGVVFDSTDDALEVDSI